MCREQMIDDILEALRNTDDATVEEVYWLLALDAEF